MFETSLAANPLFKRLKERDALDAQAYMGILLLVETHIREALDYIKTIFPNFTDHGMGHSLRILEKLSQIMHPRLQDELSSPEFFCLIMAALFHDMGLSKAEPVGPVRQREQHHLYAEKPLEEFMSNNLTVIKEWKRLFNCILFVCQAHGMELGALYSSDDFGKTDSIQGGLLRFGLLAVLLRIGDLLDSDENRTSIFSRELNPSYFQDEHSRTHHIRHEHIDLFRLTPEEITIQVQASNVEEYHIWDEWLHNLEADILHANTRVMPKLPQQGLILPEPKFTIRKSEGAKFETEKLRFELTEEGRIWNILSQSVYTEEFDFIRELIQNGIDAVLMKDYLSSEIELPAPSPRSWGCWERGGKVTVAYSARQAVLLVWDTGVGMELEEVRRFLFRIADSGHYYCPNPRSFSFPAIAKFGIGFISCLSKCKEIVLLTQPTSGAEGCRVRMFSNSICAFFEKLNVQPASGTMVYMSLNRSYPAGNVKEYLHKTFHCPSVPVEWLDLDEMGNQMDALCAMKKLNAPPDSIHGYHMSQGEFETYYCYYDSVRQSIYQERKIEADTVKELSEYLEDYFKEWRSHMYDGNLTLREFERELSILLRRLHPLDKHSDIRIQLANLLKDNKPPVDKDSMRLVFRSLEIIQDCLDGLYVLKEQLFISANQFSNPRRIIGFSKLDPLWHYQTCYVSIDSEFRGKQFITEKEKIGNLSSQMGFFVVQCSFDDWQLGVEWRSIHCFLARGNELVSNLSNARELFDEEHPEVDMEELFLFGDTSDYGLREFANSYIGQLNGLCTDSIIVRAVSLVISRDQVIRTIEQLKEIRDPYGDWYVKDTSDERTADFFQEFIANLSSANLTDIVQMKDLMRIQNGFFQDGIALDVDPTDVVPVGMCRAQVNLSGGARMELNITRHQIDEAHASLDSWLYRVGREIQHRTVAQLKEAFQDWGFEGNIPSLCTAKQNSEGYLGEQSLRQFQQSNF